MRQRRNQPKSPLRIHQLRSPPSRTHEEANQKAHYSYASEEAHQGAHYAVTAYKVQNQFSNTEAHYTITNYEAHNSLAKEEANQEDHQTITN